MTQVSLDDWREYVALHPSAHLLQTPEWGELKSAFGWDAVRVICENTGVQILFRSLPLGFGFGYLPKPSPDTFGYGLRSSLWEEVASICRARHAILLKIEPDEWETGITLGDAMRSPVDGTGPKFRRSNYSIQPPRTMVVDLRGGEDEILGHMRQKCRYNIRLAEKKGVIVRRSDDIASFHAMTKITGDRDGFAVHSAGYYRRAYELFHASGNCELLVAQYGDLPLAALMVFRQGQRAWYLYGASNNLERNRMPTYLLQWEAMRWAKDRGCTEYDMWGVPDEDEPVLEANFEVKHSGLWGVYRFKRGFGGRLRRAAQALDLAFNPFWYRLLGWWIAARESA